MILPPSPPPQNKIVEKVIEGKAFQERICTSVCHEVLIHL